MIDTITYKRMMDKYGDVASWAVWSPAEDTAKSNVGDMSIFGANDICNKLNPNYVFVGLNRSEHDEREDGYIGPWFNFHSPDPDGNDFKLRFALAGTKYWGAYMTDIIKDFIQTESDKVVEYLRNHPDVARKNAEEFEKEIEMLGTKPVIIVLGGKTYKVMKELLPKLHIVKAYHFSHFMSKEKYREHLLQVLSDY